MELNSSLSSLNTCLTTNNTTFYFDNKNGKYGFNTDPNRGADTFYPFLSGLPINPLNNLGFLIGHIFSNTNDYIAKKNCTITIYVYTANTSVNTQVYKNNSVAFTATNNSRHILNVQRGDVISAKNTGGWTSCIIVEDDFSNNVYGTVGQYFFDSPSSTLYWSDITVPSGEYMCFTSCKHRQMPISLNSRSRGMLISENVNDFTMGEYFTYKGTVKLNANEVVYPNCTYNDGTTLYSQVGLFLVKV